MPALKGRPFCQALAQVWTLQLRKGGMCEVCHQHRLSEEIWGCVGEKTPGQLQMPLLQISRPRGFQTNLLTWYLLSWPLCPAAQIDCESVLGNLGMLPGVRGKAARLKCKRKSMEGQRRVSLTSRPQRSNMSHLSWPLVQVF